MKERKNMTHPVVWFEVNGKDASRLQSFYGDLFGWKINADHPRKYGMVEAVTPRGIPGGVGAEKVGVTFYVATSDIEKSLAQAKKLGGKVLQERTQFPGGPVLAFFSDPDGNAIGLVEEE